MTKKDFSKYIEKGNSIIDFWAEWCGPCKIMEPHFKKAAEKHKNIKFGKVNVDSEYDLSSEFQVMSIPTTIFFKDGEIVERNVGAMSESAIGRKIQEAFS